MLLLAVVENEMKMKRSAKQTFFFFWTTVGAKMKKKLAEFLAANEQGERKKDDRNAR